MKKLMFLLPILLLIGCKSKQPEPTVVRIEGYWTLDRLASAGAQDVSILYPNDRPTLNIDLKLNRASGKNGCNSYSGPVSVVGNAITFGPDIITTKMACPGDGEAAYMDALQKVNAYSVGNDGTLTLLTGDVATLRFVKN